MRRVSTWTPNAAAASLVALVLLIGPPAAAAPRADIVFLYDTSGSMASAGDPWGGSQCTHCGSDCLAARTGDVDICGDGMCSGTETSASCAADCNLTDNDTPISGGISPAGQAPECGLNSRSFMAMSKQVLRNLLPAIRDRARLALITQNQSGYYRYYEGTTARASKKVSVFLTEWEMRNLGAWDATLLRPKASFVWPQSGVTLTLVSDASAGLSVSQNALYFRDNKVELEKRFAYAGSSLTSGGHSWSYVGSYYTYAQLAVRPSSVRTEAAYRGPQFVDGAKTWVYGRWRYANCASNQQGFQGACGAPLFLVQFDPSSDPAAQNKKLGDVLAHANKATNGGMFANGPTPLGPALDAVKQHFIDRVAGNGPFASWGPDPSSTCRKRLVILITDTTLSCSNSTEALLAAHAKTLYNLDPNNRVLTYVISLPGGDITKVDDIARDGGTTAIQVTNQTDLIAKVKAILKVATSPDAVPTCPAAPCSSSGKCAPTYVCQNGKCVQPTPDVGVLADATVDAGAPDTGGGTGDATAGGDGATLDAAAADASAATDAPADGGASSGDGSSSSADGGASSGDGAAQRDVGDTVRDAADDGAQARDAPSGDGSSGDGSSGGDGASAGDTFGGPASDGGCDCQSGGRGAPTGASVALLLLAFALLGRRRRRRRRAGSGSN